MFQDVMVANQEPIKNLTEEEEEEEQNATQIIFQFGNKTDPTPKSQNNMYFNSPGEDEFEEHNISEEIHEGKQAKEYSLEIMNHLKIDQLRSPHTQDITSNEGSSQNQAEIDLRHQRLIDELSLHKDAYQKVNKYYPPNPILPKNFQMQEGSPRSGGEFAFLKLTKFRGKDFGKSKFEVDLNVNHIEFPENTTLKQIFLPSNETDDRITPFGEIVFIRSALDFSIKVNQPGSKKDEVLEENLIDVRRILKNSTFSKNTENMLTKEQGGQKRAGLIQLHGVDQYYKKKDQFDRTIIFESRFESGNLASALKVNDGDYHLLLQNDVNTSGHTQWFFFRVTNTKMYNQVRFNMLNLSKPDSLYNEGMKVLIYSEKLSQEKDIGWHRGGTKISYYMNGIKKESQKRSKSHYTLTFTYEFQYDDDIVYFAYCYPYTFSDLQDDLNKISSDPVKSSFCARKTLCTSVAENKIEMLTITSRQNLDNLPKRKGVFLTARVHPGESVGSWMMKGAIDFLTDENNEEAEILRQNFVFKIIPMLNPDGVINGNYRCSLAGCDLNRRWKAPSKVLHPCIYYTKQLIQNFSKERELIIFCDFHGHSRRKNIFMYGCHVPTAPEETRFFPFLLSKICPFFVFGLSRFGNQKSKEATARVAMFNDLKLPAIYTMESSFCGNDQGPFANYHFSTDNLMQTGRDFCRTLLIYQNIQVPTSISMNILTEVLQLHCHYKEQNDLKDHYSKDQEIELMRIFVEKIQQYREKSPDVKIKHIKKALMSVLRQTQDLIIDGETTSSAGSDQAPSEDNMEPEEIQNLVPVLEEDPSMKKNKQRSRKETMQSQEMATSISPVRRKNTMENTNATNANQNMKKPGTKNTNKRMSILKTQDQKQIVNSNSKNQLSNSRRGTLEDNKIDEEDLKDKVGKESSDQDDTVTHKKKRKRNVDSRDAWTQTERSDYMLIKYRQKQKQAILMAKSQKFTKEEQIFYEQALAQQYQQNAYMNRTQEITSGTSSSVNMPLTHLIRQGKSHNVAASHNTTNPLPTASQSLSTKIQSAVLNTNAKLQNDPLNRINPAQSQSNHLKLNNSNYSISNSYARKQNEYSQQPTQSQNQMKAGNYSRNVQSQQSNSKHRQQQQKPNPSQQNIHNDYKLQDTLQLQVINQNGEILRSSNDPQFNQQQHNNLNHYPYNALNTTQDIKQIERFDYQSTKLNTINAQNTIANNNLSGQKNLPNNNNMIQGIQQPQTVLPQISTPNQISGKKKINQSGIIPNYVQNNLKKSMDANSNSKNSSGSPFMYYKQNPNMRPNENQSELSSNHSTQRIANNISFNIKGNNEHHQQNHGSFIESQHISKNQSNNNQNVQRSLPPKPQSTNLKINQINNDILINQESSNDFQHNQQIHHQDQNPISNIRVMENTYIQQKLMQSHNEAAMMNHSKRLLSESESKVMSDYDTIRLDNNIFIGNQSSNAQINSGQSQVQHQQQHKPLHPLKGNFFQNPSILDPATQSNNSQNQSLKTKNKAKSDFYGVQSLQSQGGMQGQSIKKMIENSWKAVQNQHLSQSFYQGNLHSQNQQQQFFGTATGSFLGLSSSPIKPQNMSVGRNKKGQLQSSQGVPQRQSQVNQFINVQGIIPGTLNNQSGQNSSNGKVKISIVNVHNEFIINPLNNNFTNINNNITINNNGGGANIGGKQSSKTTSQQRRDHKKKQ